MEKCIVLILLLPAFVSEINCLNKSDKRLSRSKRYIAFPDGSTLSVAICMTSQVITLPSELFTEAVNWGISYNLPNTSSTLNLFQPYNPVRRKNRRDLYQKMEVIMNSMGYNGRTCIFRALCETATITTGGNVLEEIFKTIFRFPLEKILDSEPEEHREYQAAYKVGEKEGSEGCARAYPDCSFSLLDFALGRFSSYPSYLPK